MNTSFHATRYNSTAVLFHWLMAALMISMLAIGNWMTSLEKTAELRYELTQWHKSVGIIVLFLAITRLLWRWMSASPKHPDAAPRWEKLAAALTHFVLYALIFAIPLTGWMMVSASPLSIETRLFNSIPFPHFPGFAELVDKESTASLLHQLHAMGSKILAALVVLHIAAALKHHLINKDDVLKRMLPEWGSPSFRRTSTAFAAITLLLGGGVVAYSKLSLSPVTALIAGENKVSFMTKVMGANTLGVFTKSEVQASILINDLENSSLVANVTTQSVESDNQQVKGSLPESDWFNSEQFPTAEFISSSMSLSEDKTLMVTGTLTIKGINHEYTFPVVLAEQTNASDADKTQGNRASGAFVVSRADYQLGLQSQPTTEYVADEVEIRFEFELK